MVKLVDSYGRTVWASYDNTYDEWEESLICCPPGKSALKTTRKTKAQLLEHIAELEAGVGGEQAELAEARNTRSKLSIKVAELEAELTRRLQAVQSAEQARAQAEAAHQTTLRRLTETERKLAEAEAKLAAIGRCKIVDSERFALLEID